MANIASSSYRTGSPEVDGRTWVFETHVDVASVSHALTYLAAQGANLAANLATHATNLGNDLANAEIANNFTLLETQGKNAVPTEIFSTTAQNVAALVAAWPTLLNAQAIFIGEYLNTLSLATLESVFGWTPAQAQAASTAYLIPYAAMAANIRAAQGGLF